MFGDIVQKDDIIKIVLPVLTFVGGFITSRCTFSKKERYDVKVQRQTKSEEIMSSIAMAYSEYVASITEYINSKENDSDLNMFMNIATKGEAYFCRIRSASSVILANGIDRAVAERDYFPLIKRFVEEVLPEHYKTLREIAGKLSLTYDGELKRENYTSVYDVYEKMIV